MEELMKIGKEHLEKARAALGVICLIALALSAGVLGLSALKGAVYDTYVDSISSYPPYDFPKADSLTQTAVYRLEQKGLTRGEIDPYFHRFGTLGEHYQNLISIQGQIHQFALDYPKPPEGVTYDYEAIKPIAQPLLKQASSLTGAYVVEIYDMFHAKKWWTVIFFLSVFGAAYGFLDLAKN